MTGIYGIKNKQNNKWYVGQAVDIEKRWRDHRKSSRQYTSAGLKLQQAFAKYGHDEFEWVVLEECAPCDLDEREVFWIAQKNSFKSGYNMTLGGGGRRGYELSQETRAKIGAANRGANNWLYGKSLPQETREKIAKANKGKRTGQKASDETRQKQSRARKGQKFTAEHRAAISAATRNKKTKPVRCIDTGMEYPGMQEAERQTGISATCICRCCKGQKQHAGGMRWEYIEKTNIKNI